MTATATLVHTSSAHRANMDRIARVAAAARVARERARWDRITQQFDAALVTLAETGEAPARIAHLVTKVAERDGSRVFLTVAAPNGDFIAGSRCDIHGIALEDGCGCGWEWAS